MKNLISLFILSIVLIFGSCTKETLAPVAEMQQEGSIGERSITIEIDVAEIYNSESGDDFLVDFSASYDFTESVLEPTQFLKFSDSAGNITTLTFPVNSFVGSNGLLQTVFSLNGNNLAGLEIAEAQEIIIEDALIE